MTDLNDKTKRMESIQRYLNAETTIQEELLLLEFYTLKDKKLTPEEDNVRLLLVTSHAHPYQIELSEQKEDEFDQLMQPFYHHDKVPRNHHLWLYPFIGAVAASLLLLLTLHQNKVENKEQTVVAQQSATVQIPQPLPSFEEMSNLPVKMKPETTEKRLKQKDKKTQIRRQAAAEQGEPIPDTLGNGIWESKENVLNALKMLADCEATIEREVQDVRNGIIQATFRATPQPAGVRLVSNEAGDYEVVDPQMIIDL